MAETTFTQTEVTAIAEAMDMSIKATQRQINTRTGAVRAAYEAERDKLELLKAKLINELGEQKVIPMKSK